MSETPIQKKTEAEEAKPPANQNENTADDSITIPPIGTQPPPTVTGDEPAPQKPYKWRKAVRFWAELIGLGMLIIYTSFAGCQWKELSTQTGLLIEQANRSGIESAGNAARVERQLKIAHAQVKAAQDSVAAIQRQMRQDQRPWIQFYITDSATDPILPVSWDVKVGGPLTIPIKLINIGKTPAENVETIVLIDVIPRGKEPQLGKNFKRFFGGKLSRREYMIAALSIGTGVIFPGRHIMDTAHRVEISNGKTREKILSVAEANDLAQGKAYLVIYGEVRYRDVFGIHHWTRFCVNNLVTTGGNAGSAKCADYAAVDNN